MKRLPGPDKIEFTRRPPLGRRAEAVLFKDGDLVCDIDNAKRRGKVVLAGPEQSEVRWSANGPSNSNGVSVEINRFLRKLGRSI